MNWMHQLLLERKLERSNVKFTMLAMLATEAGIRTYVLMGIHVILLYIILSDMLAW